MQMRNRTSTTPRQIPAKLIHSAGTALLIFSALYLWLSALTGAVGMPIPATLPAWSTLIIFPLISLYLFAIFRALAKSQKSKQEHPLTTSVFYATFYDLSPFMGLLAGIFAAGRTNSFSSSLTLTAFGSLVATLLIWIFLDPIAGLVELALPASRKHRRKRQALAKAARQKQLLIREQLLEQIKTTEEKQNAHWTKLLTPHAEKLAALLLNHEIADNAEHQAIDLGVIAWQIGGISCMKLLHSMAIEICKKNYKQADFIDCISIWWDGLGTWQTQWIDEAALIKVK
jgi:hypothetical protein